MQDTVMEKAQPKQYMTIPDRIIVKPIQLKEFKLGLEKTKEKFVRLPGVRYRWAPSKKGNTYLTGLHHIPMAKRVALEKAIGRELNDEYYADLTYIMDGSNPNGHHMDLSEPTELIVYLAFIESELIATSRSQHTNGSKPFAEWYIEDNEIEAEEQEKARDKTMQVNRIYDGLTETRRSTFAKLLGINVQGVSAKVGAAKLWTLLTEPTRTRDKMIDRFIEISRWTDEKINVFAEVKDALSFNILRRNSAQDIIYAEQVLGATEEQVVSKLLMGENGQLRISIREKIELHPR